MNRVGITIKSFSSSLAAPLARDCNKCTNSVTKALPVLSAGTMSQIWSQVITKNTNH